MTPTDGTPLESMPEDFSAYERMRLGTEEPKDEVEEKPSEAAEPEKPVEPEPAPDSDPEDEQEPDEEPVKGKRLNKRFAQLTAKIRELEAQVASKPGVASPQPEASEDPEPDPNRFDDYKEYIKAQIRWEDRKEAAAKSKAEAEAKAKAEAEKVVADYAERVKKLAKDPDYADFGLKVNAINGKIHPAIAEAIMTDENGPKVAYKVASDAKLLEKLQGMSLPQAIRELGKLSAKFDAAPEEKKSPVSKAPAPPKPVSSPSASPEKSLYEIDDFGEYEKKRLAQLKRR